MSGAISPLPNTPPWRGAQLKHRDNFTFTLRGRKLPEAGKACTVRSSIMWDLRFSRLWRFVSWSSMLRLHVGMRHGTTVSEGLAASGWSETSLSYYLTTASRTALGLTQPPIQWIPGVLYLGVKRPGSEADHSPSSSAEAKDCAELYLHSPIRLLGVVLSWSTGTTLALPSLHIIRVITSRRMGCAGHVETHGRGEEFGENFKRKEWRGESTWKSYP
jgi:hypothetical protein